MRQLATGLLGFLAVGLTASQQGGFFPPAWGWSALGLLIVTAAALVFRVSLETAPLRSAFLFGFGSVVTWTALSSDWSASVPRTVAEVERSIVYLAAISALFTLASSRDRRPLLTGLLAAIVAVSVHALALDSGPRDAEGLSGSLGYWNALGILGAIGILLCVGLATRTSPGIVRLGAIGSLPILAITVYLTQSRGAAMALAVGLLLYLALDPRLRRAALAAALIASIGGGAVLIVGTGGPGDLISRMYAAFSAPVGADGQPRETLLSLSGNERAAYWRVAWDVFLAHPLFGSGAGTFAVHWLRDRTTIYGAQDAHNLYLETLSELGVVGLFLLVATLLVPFIALRNGRADPLDRSAAAAYVAFLIHAGVDWDWEMPAVTLAGLLCGGGLLLAVAERRRPITTGLRASALALAMAVAAFTTAGFIGNSAIQGSVQAAADGDLEHSADEARAAARWNPWSSEARRLQGEMARARGRTGEAEANYRAGIVIDRNDWRLWYDLALVTEGSERRQALDEAERLNPLSAEVRELRGR